MWMHSWQLGTFMCKTSSLIPLTTLSHPNKLTKSNIRLTSNIKQSVYPETIFPSCQVCTTCSLGFHCGRRRGFIHLNIFTSLYFIPTHINKQTLLSVTYTECQNKADDVTVHPFLPSTFLLSDSLHRTTGDERSPYVFRHFFLDSTFVILSCDEVKYTHTQPPNTHTFFLFTYKH